MTVGLTRGWSGPARNQLITAGPRWEPADQQQDVRRRRATMASRVRTLQPEAPRRLPRLSFVHQFLIVLAGTNPVVWRRIQVPARYSFWDLHVAIQDAMGWEDYHLHEFTLPQPKHDRSVRIGIPDDEFPEERPCLAGWKTQISEYFDGGSWIAGYVYDFGDNWEHAVLYEGPESPARNF